MCEYLRPVVALEWLLKACCYCTDMITWIQTLIYGIRLLLHERPSLVTPELPSRGTWHGLISVTRFRDFKITVISLCWLWNVRDFTWLCQIPCQYSASILLVVCHVLLFVYYAPSECVRTSYIFFLNALDYILLEILASKIVQLSAAPSHSCRSRAWYSLVRGSGVYSSFCGRFISLPYERRRMATL